MPHPDVHTIWMIDQRKKLQNVGKIIQRFSNSHHNNIGYFFSAVLLGQYHLVQYFSGCQVSNLATQSRGAKDATHIAAHLTGHAHSIPMLVAHQYRLYTISVPKPPQVFYGSVNLGGLLALHHRNSKPARLAQLLSQRFGQIAHLLKGLHSLMKPSKCLQASKSGLIQFLQLGCHFFRRH